MSEPNTPTKPDTCRLCNGTGICTDGHSGNWFCSCDSGTYAAAFMAIYRQLGKSEKAKVKS